jgi:lysozyme family protein
MYTKAFDEAVNHAMLYEVGGGWKLTTEVEAGLIGTKDQRRAVGYVDDPVDNGGETKFGVAKNANKDLNIAALTWAQAKDVYYRRYWLNGSCDKLPARVAVLHFDGCVNHGVGRANKFLQRAAGVGVDGVIGPMTIGAVTRQSEIVICNAICDQREAFYQSIIDNNPSQGRYRNGWMRRITEMRDFVTDPQNSF